ncbi:hypothetical protein V8C35DRAFT_307687 [Trichoderma chlorosporum]
MTQLTNLLLVLLSAFASVIQAQTPGKPSPSPSPKPPPPPPSCLIKDIRQMDVSKCDCEGHHDGCHADCKVCPKQYTVDHRDTTSPGCAVGCTDADKECKGCGLWFSTLCNCIKKGNCDHLGSYTTPGKDAVFVLTQGDEQLVTTTDLLPGILEMAKNPDRYEPAWSWAQEQHWDQATQALALNSVRSRTHEQFHIHLCPKPEAPERRILDIVDAIPVKDHIHGSELKQVGQNYDLWCRTIENTQKPIVNNFVESIREALPKVACDKLAGAGIIRDKYHNIWACVTNNTSGPLSYFCKKPPPKLL